MSAAICCGHAVEWHHAERGCQYHGNGPTRCPCVLSGDAYVARVRDAALDEAARVVGVTTMRWLYERESCDWWGERPVADVIRDLKATR